MKHKRNPEKGSAWKSQFGPHARYAPGTMVRWKGSNLRRDLKDVWHYTSVGEVNEKKLAFIVAVVNHEWRDTSNVARWTLWSLVIVKGHLGWTTNDLFEPLVKPPNT